MNEKDKQKAKLVIANNKAKKDAAAKLAREQGTVRNVSKNEDKKPEGN